MTSILPAKTSLDVNARCNCVCAVHVFSNEQVKTVVIFRKRSIRHKTEEFVFIGVVWKKSTPNFDFEFCVPNLSDEIQYIFLIWTRRYDFIKLHVSNYSTNDCFPTTLDYQRVCVWKTMRLNDEPFSYSLSVLVYMFTCCVEKRVHLGRTD